jgi:hypothetical protein
MRHAPPPKPPKPGILARLSARVRVFLAVVLILGMLFALIFAFGAGLVVGLVIDANGAKNRCEAQGGTWSIADRLCGKQEQAASPSGEMLRYSCEREGFTIEATDPEIMTVTRGAGAEPEWYAFTSFEGETRVFAGEEGTVKATGRSATFEEKGSGEVTRCSAT